MASSPELRADHDPHAVPPSPLSHSPREPVPFRPALPATPITFLSLRVRRGGYARPTIAIVLFCAAVIAVTWLWSTPVLNALGGIIDLARRNDDGRGRLLATTVMGAGGALAVTVAWGLATRLTRPVRLASGRGTIAVEEIAERLRAMLIERSDIVAAEALVENRHRSGLRVTAWLEVTPQAHLLEVTDAVSEYGELLLHERLGVPMSEPPQVHLTYRELDLTARRAHDRSDRGDGGARRATG